MNEHCSPRSKGVEEKEDKEDDQEDREGVHDL